MAIWQKETNGDKVLKIILFLISPFFSFLYALKRMNTRSSYVIFFLFAIFFGLSFTVNNVRTEGSTDGISYRIDFELYKNVSENQYFNGLRDFLTFDEGSKDYYFDTVAFYVSRITDNYHIMFLVFAIVFGFFQLKTFRFFTTEENFNNSLICVLLAFLFTYNQIFNINGMRFWTAGWLGVYCIFQIFLKDNKKYFFLALCTPFFHGSFWIYILVIVFAYFLKKFERIWIVLFFISFIFSSFAVELIQSTIDYLPLFLTQLINSYTSDDMLLLKQQEGTGFWIIGKIFGFFVKVYVNLSVYFLIRNRGNMKNQHVKNLYLFLLVWMTFVNFVMPVPSLGIRFFCLAYPIIAYLWLANFSDVKYRYWIYAIPFVFFMRIYYLLYDYVSVLDFSFYFSSPLILFCKYILFL